MISSQRVLPLCVLLSLSACQCTTNPDVDPLSIIVEPATLSLVAGGEAGALTAHRVNGEDVTALVTWTSENDAIAKVEGGRVSGLALGTLTITAQLDQYSAGAGVDVSQACADGIRNGAETDVDCGGPECADCAPGRLCNVGNDCTTNVCASGVCTSPASCSDRIRNGSESGVDCGGHQCPACGTGETCSGNLDCASQNCVNGQCVAASCTDGIKNGGETATDCGGLDCPGCGTGLGCGTGDDCVSHVCMNFVCQAATCFDGVQNGDETGQDCGGSHCGACSAGGGCQQPSDCVDRVCTNGVCQPGSCTDGVLNGSETDLDCGGSCPGCQTGGGCNGANDCNSGVCSMNICLAPTCSDGVKNGQETGLDCGGPACGACTSGQGCSTGTDCLSQVCLNGVCQVPTCSDGAKNGQETGTDCGGAVCPACGNGETCVGPLDCGSRVCTGGVCQSPTCSDSVKNGAETDVDCGGGTCPVCPNGGGCTSGSDCGSGVCANGSCVIPSCTDGVKNGTETGLDCGGPDCGNCGTGQGCSTATDCTSGVCTGGLCQAATCSDGVKNGQETDIDCGGGTCTGCGIGLVCQRNSDCASGNCVSGSCGPVIQTGLTVTPATVNVPLGRTQAFIANAVMSDGTSVDVTAAATWTTGDSTYATISQTGLLQSVAQGGTDVRAVSGGFSAVANVTIIGPALDRIDVTPIGVRLPMGLVQAYEATGTFSDGSLGDVTALVTWESSSASVASISAGGIATGLSQGSTTISASAQGIIGTTALEVTDVYVTAISVTPASGRLPVGVRAAYVATALLSDGTARDVTQQARWDSSDNGVAQVSTTSPTRGLVTPLTAGTTNISATLIGNTGVGVLTVINATLNLIQVFPADETVPRGFELQYGAVGLYSDGNAYDLTLSATWSSTASSVASVSNTFPDQGVVSTLTAGNTMIQASFSGQTGATSLRVTNAALSSLSITPALLTLPIGAPRQYRATGVFDDGTARDVTSLVRWSSSNLGVASISNAVNSRGLLMTIGAGNATITATLGTQTATSALRVTNATFEQLSVAPPTPRIGIQGVASFTATAVYNDGTAIDVTELCAWTSSSPNIASVRNDTGYRGVAVGLQPGLSNIRATFGANSATSKLTVTSAMLLTIYISPAVVRTGIGIHVQFQASGFWADGTTADLTRVATWTSSLNSVAVVSNAANSEGLATTRGQGVTTVRASWAGESDDTTLTVTNASLTSIAVTPSTTITGIGLEVPYRAVATFSDGTKFDVTTGAAWTSSSTSVASVSGAAGSVGVATALSGGTTTITARMGAVSGTATLNVSSAALTGVTVTPPTGIIPVAYWRQYTATAVFADGLQVDVTRQASWTSSNPLIAHAGNGGMYGGRVTGIAPGTSTVLARFGGFGATATATVKLMTLTLVVVTPDNATTPVGVPIQLTATGTFTDGTTTITLDITLQVGWKVSPKKGGTVSNTDGSRGVVTMYSSGDSALIHAVIPDPNNTAGDAHTKVNSP